MPRRRTPPSVSNARTAKPTAVAAGTAANARMVAVRSESGVPTNHRTTSAAAAAAANGSSDISTDARP